MTQSSCEDKSLHLCCFDYPHSVSGHLAPSCSFFNEEETVSVITSLSALPSWRAEAEPAGCDTHRLHHQRLWWQISLTNCHQSASLSKPRLSLGEHLTGHLHDNRRMSLPVYQLYGRLKGQLDDSVVFPNLSVVLILPFKDTTRVWRSLNSYWPDYSPQFALYIKMDAARRDVKATISLQMKWSPAHVLDWKYWKQWLT